MTNKPCGGKAPQSSVPASAVNECISSFQSGNSLRATAQSIGYPIDAVARAVRRIIPNAWRRQTSKLIAANDNKEVVQKWMPHQVSWSTDPVQGHLISLPRLKCLEKAA